MGALAPAWKKGEAGYGAGSAPEYSPFSSATAGAGARILRQRGILRREPESSGRTGVGSADRFVQGSVEQALGSGVRPAGSAALSARVRYRESERACVQTRSVWSGPVYSSSRGHGRGARGGRACRRHSASRRSAPAEGGASVPTRRVPWFDRALTRALRGRPSASNRAGYTASRRLPDDAGPLYEESSVCGHSLSLSLARACGVGDGEACGTERGTTGGRAALCRLCDGFFLCDP